MKRFSIGKLTLPVYSVLAIAFMLIPIVYTIVFSFNNSNRGNTTWKGFTLDKWLGVNRWRIDPDRNHPWNSSGNWFGSLQVQGSCACEPGPLPTDGNP